MFRVKYALCAVAAFLFVLPLSAQYRNTGNQASYQYMQNLVGNLLQQVKALQDENARLADEVQRLSRDVQNLQANSGRSSVVAALRSWEKPRFRPHSSIQDTAPSYSS